jgi:hypothetical protein
VRKQNVRRTFIWWASMWKWVRMQTWSKGRARTFGGQRYQANTFKRKCSLSHLLRS